MAYPTDEEIRDIMKYGKTIKSQLPIVFSNKCQVHDYILTCSCCSKPIESSLIKGTVKIAIDDVYNISSAYACFDCLTISFTENRIRGIKRGYQLERIENGSWVAYQFVHNPTHSPLDLIHWLGVAKDKFALLFKK